MNSRSLLSYFTSALVLLLVLLLLVRTPSPCESSPLSTSIKLNLKQLCRLRPEVVGVDTYEECLEVFDRMVSRDALVRTMYYTPPKKIARRPNFGFKVAQEMLEFLKKIFKIKMIMVSSTLPPDVSRKTISWLCAPARTFKLAYCELCPRRWVVSFFFSNNL